MKGNSVKKIRESLLMSKTELARKAKVSPITIARIEKVCLAAWKLNEKSFWPLVSAFLTKTKYLVMNSIS
jgi:predicted transcriptional regulator